MAVDIMKYFPLINGKELIFLGNLTSNFSESEMSDFAMAYNARRKSSTTTLLLDLFLGGLGIHRFYLGQTGMGILYLFTLGLFGIGAIIDLFLFKKITLDRNAEIANEIAFTINRSDRACNSAQCVAEDIAKTNSTTSCLERCESLPASSQTQCYIDEQQPVVPVMGVQESPQTQCYTETPHREMYICGLSGIYNGERINVSDSPIVIGRDAALCSLVIEAGDISRRHAQVYLGRTPDSVMIEDLGSTNGTFVQINGVWTRISEPTVMTIFMRFRLGCSDNEFEIR